MKHFLLSVTTVIIISLFSCNKSGTGEVSQCDTNAIIAWYKQSQARRESGADTAKLRIDKLIPLEEANKMIKNYHEAPVSGVGYTSYRVLVSELNDILSNNPDFLHIMLARQIDDPNYPITILIAGLNEEGKHIYTDDDKVLEYVIPCNSHYTTPICTVNEHVIQDTCEY